MPGKKKNKLQSGLKRVMDWRNAFAHGKVQHDSLHGCLIKYYSGEPRTLKLTDDFWTELEEVFRLSSEFIKEASDGLDKLQKDQLNSETA